MELWLFDCLLVMDTYGVLVTSKIRFLYWNKFHTMINWCGFLSPIASHNAFFLSKSTKEFNEQNPFSLMHLHTRIYMFTTYAWIQNTHWLTIFLQNSSTNNNCYSRKYHILNARNNSIVWKNKMSCDFKTTTLCEVNKLNCQAALSYHISIINLTYLS